LNRPIAGSQFCEGYTLVEEQLQSKLRSELPVQIISLKELMNWKADLRAQYTLISYTMNKALLLCI